MPDWLRGSGDLGNCTFVYLYLRLALCRIEACDAADVVDLPGLEYKLWARTCWQSVAVAAAGTCEIGFAAHVAA